MYLGVDGGGTKTALVLIDRDGTIRATHQAPGCYYLSIGLDALGALLADARQRHFGQGRRCAPMIWIMRSSACPPMARIRPSSAH